MDKLNFYILLLATISPFVATIRSTYISRQNLKTSKYIDTITTERLIRIKNLRKDISTLISWIMIYTYYKHEIVELQTQWYDSSNFPLILLSV